MNKILTGPYGLYSHTEIATGKMGVIISFYILWINLNSYGEKKRLLRMCRIPYNKTSPKRNYVVRETKLLWRDVNYSVSIDSTKNGKF